MPTALESPEPPNERDGGNCQEKREIIKRAHISAPVCDGLAELPDAAEERAELNRLMRSASLVEDDVQSLRPIQRYIAHGLALTTGSAVEEAPPSDEECLDAFLVPNSAGLTTGARAWTKHAHRDQNNWWGKPKGSVTEINALALDRFENIMRSATWRNLHWLPHNTLVYEVRVNIGYGMRWSQARGDDTTPLASSDKPQPWTFRGFVEPMMEDGHELKWRH